MTVLVVIGGILLVLITYGVLIERKWFEVTEPDLYIHQLADEFDGYRIAHITDIHMDSSMTTDRMKRVASLITDNEADLIVITGDFVSYDVESVTNELREALGTFRAPDGVLAVMGNHDHMSGVGILRSVLEDVGIKELENDYLTIERNGKKFYMAGVDDVSAKKSRLDLVLSKLPEDAPAILLAHEPDFADVAAATGRFQAQLSGHTHGGQMQLPFIGAFFGPEHGHRYSDRIHDIANNMQLYVSRGVGTVMAPIRINCRPEIPIFTLRAIKID